MIDCPFVVREVNAQWPIDFPWDATDLVTGKLEALIADMWAQGYKLHSWQLRQYVPPDSPSVQLVETIVAVFEKAEGARELPATTAPPTVATLPQPDQLRKELIRLYQTVRLTRSLLRLSEKAQAKLATPTGS